MSKRNREKRLRALEAAEVSSETPWELLVIKICAFAAPVAALFGVMGIDGYSLPKAGWFQICTEIALAAWIVLAVRDRRYRPDWRHPLLLATLVFAGVMIAVLPFSLEPLRSFWSTYIRMTGALNILHYTIWVLVLSSSFRDWSAWRGLLFWTTLVALGVDFVALVQWMQNPSTRVAGTIGNALYLGGYIVLMLWIALLLFVRSKNGFAKFGYGCAAALHVLTLFSSGSRGAFAALGVTGALLAVYLVFSFLKGRRRWVVGIIFAAVVVSSALSVAWLRSPGGYGWGQKNLPLFLNRAVYSGLGGDRTSLWTIAWQGFLEKPIFGWGLENYGVVFNTFVEPTGRDKVLGEPWYDRAHNGFIDILVSTGLIGLLAYLAIYAAAAWAVWRTARAAAEPDERLGTVVLGLATVAYAIFLVGSFDIAIITATWYMIVAATVALTPRRRDDAAPALPAPEPWSPQFAVLTFSAAFVMAYYFNLLPYGQVLDVIKAYRLTASAPEQALSLYKKALQPYTLATPDVRQRMSEGIRTAYTAYRVTTKPVDQELVRLSVAEMDKEIARRPFDFKFLLMAAYAFRTGMAVDPEADAVKVEETIARAIAASPQRPEPYEELAELALVRGDLAAAERHSAEARKRTANIYFLARQEFRDAVIYARQDRPSEASVALEKSFNFYSYASDTRLILPLAYALPDGQPNEPARRYADALASAYPNASETIEGWVLVHWKTGDREGARPILEKLGSNYPDMARRVRQELGLQ